MCSAYGFIGLYPGDNGPFDSALPRAELSRVIFESNLAMMRAADLLVANLTPFRGPGADPGTVWELGYMAGVGKPVFAYSNAPETLLTRTRMCDPAASLDARRGVWRDGAGREIEDLGAGENLMLIEALRAAGSELMIAGTATADSDRDLAAFERCLALAARRMKDAS